VINRLTDLSILYPTIPSVWGLMGAPGICSEPNGAPGFAQVSQR
jgi:hypothetical protein